MLDYQETPETEDIHISLATLHPKQSLAFLSQATEVLYGGAAGSAKSHLVRVSAIAWCSDIPGLQVYLFRRIREDLIKNHMEGPTGFRAMLAAGFNEGIEAVEDEIRFPNGSKIYLCHCKDEKDKYKYQGAEIHVLLIDELTHFTESIYRFLRSRVRMPESLNVPDQYKGLFPRILCATNPGGIGHQFVKSTWLDKRPALECYRTDDEEGGFVRQFIPARLADNPSINQASYRANLSGLGNQALVKAMLEGDWDVVAGAALDVTRERHMLRPFTIPKHMTKFMVIDWGYVKPYYVGWFAVMDNDVELAERGDYEAAFLPKGSVVLYRELYGSNGRPNEGARQESPVVAENIMRIEKEADEKMDYRVGDAAMWAKNDGVSIAERMQQAGVMLRPSKKDRQAGYQEICARLLGEQVQTGIHIPMFFVTANCVNWWRTVPPLVLDDIKPEFGPDTDQDDHAYDTTQYALMSRPYMRTVTQRIDSKFKTLRAKHMVDKRDPYQTKPVRKKG